MIWKKGMEIKPFGLPRDFMTPQFCVSKPRGQFLIRATTRILREPNLLVIMLCIERWPDDKSRLIEGDRFLFPSLDRGFAFSQEAGNDRIITDRLS